MHGITLVTVFQVISILAFALTALKLLTTGLCRRYRYFLAYLLFGIPYMAIALAMDVNSVAYLHVFNSLEPVVMLLSVMILFELYRLVFARYPGLYTAAKWAVRVAVAISLAISAVSFLRVRVPASTPSETLAQIMRVEANLDLGLMLFILLIVAFLTRYPVPLSRNVVVYTGVYAVFFLSNALGLVLWLFRVSLTSTTSTILLGISSACAVAWWLGLSVKGEEVKVHAPPLRPGSEERLLEQLDSLNAALTSSPKLLSGR